MMDETDSSSETQHERGQAVPSACKSEPKEEVSLPDTFVWGGAFFFIAFMLWLFAVTSPCLRVPLQAGGDAVAAVATLASAVATIFALMQLRLQREANTEQHKSQEAQLVESRRAICLQELSLKAQLEVIAADATAAAERQVREKELLERQLQRVQADQESQSQQIQLQQTAIEEQRRSILEDHRLRRIAVLIERYANLLSKLSNAISDHTSLKKRIPGSGSAQLAAKDAIKREFKSATMLLAEMQLLDENETRLKECSQAIEFIEAFLLEDSSDARAQEAAERWEAMQRNLKKSLVASSNT
jgi:hypothetical protein